MISRIGFDINIKHQSNYIIIDILIDVYIYISLYDITLFFQGTEIIIRKKKQVININWLPRRITLNLQEGHWEEPGTFAGWWGIPL